MPTFADLGVPADLCDALDARAIAAPFPIQKATIPAALAGQDVCGRAPTGSGKTLAFGIPLVASVQRARPKRPRALILVPTRELAAQVCQDLEWLGAARDVRAHAFYGGTRIEPQVKALRRGVDIAVACPGRLADLLNQKLVRLDGVDLVVIDEADRMSDMGFLPEVRRLVDQTDPNRQTLLFSATLDGDVDELIRRYQHDPVRREVAPPENNAVVTRHWWKVPHPERVHTTAAVIERMGPTIVFTRTRHGADRVARQLSKAGVSCAAIHGNRSQNQRDRALREFRDDRVQALVATDVAARGIHVDDVACVVHFDLPADPKDFVHRSGRTGRAGSDGVVVAMIMPDKTREAQKLVRSLEVDATFIAADLDTLPTPTSQRPAHKKARPPSERSRNDGGSGGRRQKQRPKPGSGTASGGGTHKPKSAKNRKPATKAGSKAKKSKARSARNPQHGGSKGPGGSGRPGGSHKAKRSGSPAGPGPKRNAKHNRGGAPGRQKASSGSATRSQGGHRSSRGAR